MTKLGQKKQRQIQRTLTENGKTKLRSDSESIYLWPLTAIPGLDRLLLKPNLVRSTHHQPLVKFWESLMLHSPSWSPQTATSKGLDTAECRSARSSCCQEHCSRKWSSHAEAEFYTGQKIWVIDYVFRHVVILSTTVIYRSKFSNANAICMTNILSALLLIQTYSVYGQVSRREETFPSSTR